MYRQALGATSIRATCMTMSQDRYHFWNIFGGKRTGVCLWFDYNMLIEDFKSDKKLCARAVNYFTPERLAKECTLALLPFAKRSQYADEREFRIIREVAEKEGQIGIAFRALSLQKIYINNWLDPSEFERERVLIQRTLDDHYRHVTIHQNKVLRFHDWIQSAKLICARV